MGNVLPWPTASDRQPERLSPHDARKLIHLLAQDSKNVYVVDHARKRQKKRSISRRQIMCCLRKGQITEGPFVNMHGNWQVNVTRLAAGEEVTCTVAIEWKRRLVVVTVF